MAWTTPITATLNGTLTAAQWNASVRDNMNQLAAAKTGKGNWWCGTGANALALRSVMNFAVNEDGVSTTSTSYTTLTGGPAITVTHGNFVIVCIKALINNDTLNSNTRMGWSISGANTVSAGDVQAVSVDGIDDGYHIRWGSTHGIFLTPGTSTFTAQYRVGSGTGTFDERYMQLWLF